MVSPFIEPPQSESISDLEALLAEQESTLGKKHADLLGTVSRLARAYRAANQQYKAEMSYWRAIELHRLVQNSPSGLVICLTELARLYDEQFREMEADRLKQWADAISSQSAEESESTAKVSIWNMPIADLLGQAGIALRSNMSEQSRKAAGITPDAPTPAPTAQVAVRPELPAKPTNFFTMPVGDLLKQANAALNAPIGFPRKPAGLPDGAATPTDPFGTIRSTGPAPNDARTASKNNACEPSKSTGCPKTDELPIIKAPAPVSGRQPTFARSSGDFVTPLHDHDDPLLRRIREVEEAQGERCPHGQILGSDFSGCLLCKTLANKKERDGKQPLAELQNSQSCPTSVVLEPSGRKFSLNSTLWIGPSTRNDIPLEHADVPTGYQACLSQDGDDWWFSELQGEQFATVNGVAVDCRKKVYVGATIKIGSFTIKIQ